MPTDATGTPTSLGIPTFNVDVDEPSGLGFNEAMVIIDSLLVSRSGVSSFVGRTGVVTANAGDYTAAKVTNAADKSAVAAQVFTGNVMTPNTLTAHANDPTGAALFTSGLFQSVAAVNQSILAASLSGDTQFRLLIDSNGKATWGTGAALGDTNLYRAGVGSLQTDGIFNALSGVLTATVAAGNAFRNYLLVGDNNPAFRILGTGALSWGAGGASALDITLSRASAGVLVMTQGSGLGYGTGTGGSVTQLTSQATAVTLNTPTGQVNMFTGPITAGQVIQFTVNNSLVTANDVVILSGIGSGIVLSASTFAGGFAVTLQNVTGSNKPSASYNLNFAIFKGAIS